MEWVAYLAGEEHSDEPMCVDTRIAHIGRCLNDFAPDDEARQTLRPLLARCIGTASTTPRALKNAAADELRLMLNNEVPGGFCAAETLSPQSFARGKELLEGLLPLEPIQVPVAEDWKQVCELIEA